MTTRKDVEAMIELKKFGLLSVYTEAIETLLFDIDTLRDALVGVVKVADRKTDEFDTARAALAQTEQWRKV